MASQIKIPPPLAPGAVIGLTCPAGYMDRASVTDCIATLQHWGYEVLVGATVGSNSSTYFSGTDEQRATEFQAMLDAPEIAAILCARGGYGVSRIIDRLDFSRFRRKPKWIAGFSDITVLHAHLNRQIGVATLHAPMAAAFKGAGARNKYTASLRATLTGQALSYTCKPKRLNRPGTTTGELVGGNLALLAHLTGTRSQLMTKDKILFLEDVGEYLYNIDRMMLQLKRSGQLAQLAGLLVGGFTDLKDTKRPFGKKVSEIIAAHVASYHYPVAFGFPVSHDTANYALRCGVRHQLKVDDTQVVLSAIAS